MGVRGNELADAAARVAAQQQMAPQLDMADLRQAFPAGDVELRLETDPYAGRTGFSASWIGYRAKPPGPGLPPPLHQFDELNHQVNAWVRPVSHEALHRRYFSKVSLISDCRTCGSPYTRQAQVLPPQSRQCPGCRPPLIHCMLHPSRR
jgi:hypothetical protein